MKPLLLVLSVIALAVLVGGVWLAGELALPVQNSAPDAPLPVLASGEDTLLRRACFDCHSDHIQYPWYARLPGVSLMIANHIREGRHELNFSQWEAMGADSRREALAESLETLKKGEKPPSSYLLFNRAARLSPAEKSRLTSGLKKMLFTSTGAGNEDEHHEKRGEHKEHGEKDDD